MQPLLQKLLYNPKNAPSLSFNFIDGSAFSPQITFTRASTATYFDSAGVLQSAAIDAPRLDYNPATLAAQGLLIEEQRTNSIYPSNFSIIDNVVVNNAWYEVLTELDTTVNAATAPDGTTTAALLAVNTTASNRSIFYRSGVSTAATYAYSVFCKANSTDTKVRLFLAGEAALTNNVRADFTLSGSGTASAATATGSAVSVATPTIQPVGNGWYRCAIYVTLTAPTNITALIYPGDAAAQTTNSQTLVWGAQLEAGAFPTSYIPTTTTALTRAADVASVNTLSPWYNAAEGTLYAEATFTTAATVQGETSITNFLTGTSTDNQLRLNRNASGETTRLRYRTAASDIAAISTNTIFGTNKIAAAFTNGSQAICANGNAPATATGVGAMPSVDNFVLGRLSTSSTGTILSGHLRRITYYPRRLSNAELQAITS